MSGYCDDLYSECQVRCDVCLVRQCVAWEKESDTKHGGELKESKSIGNKDGNGNVDTCK